jgi:hypothetical protein
LSTICRGFKESVQARSLVEARLLSLMFDAIYLPVRPDGPKEGIHCSLVPASSRDRSVACSACGNTMGVAGFLMRGV